MALTKVSTNGVKDDAITSGKIPANAVGASELADNAVDTNAIADQAVSLSKLPHGTSSTGGKFLRANNGADPTFEDVTSTTINNNAAGRVIFGSSTANTLNASSNVTFNSNILDVNNAVRLPDAGTVHFGVSDTAYVRGKDSTDGYIKLGTGGLDRVHVSPTGNVGLGLTNPEDYDSYANRLVVYGAGHAGMTIRGNYANTGNIYFADGTSGGEKYDGYVSYSYPTQRLSFGAGGNTIAKVTTDGICFGSDSAAANALDDYEEGTWTPSVSNTTNTGTTSGRVNIYRKIGSVVFFSFDIFQTNNNMSININGNTVISGLPFNTLSSFNSTMTVATYFSDGSGQQMANYIETTPQIVLHGNGEKYNLRHLWGHGFYSTS